MIVEGSVRRPLQQFLRERGFERVVIVYDAHLAELAAQAARGLGRRLLGVLPFTLGERRKTLATVQEILETLLRAGADRGTAIVGVGGGVASDLFGFAASIFMRGVPYIHLATSLVAMVDAAIGGKTGVDLPSGKNLAGTFRDPVKTFAWIDALQTLPYRHVREGLAEIVKAGIIEGGEFFDSLETLAPHPFWRWPWANVVAGAQQIKMAIVNDDREEGGMRAVLNLGHTFGHAIERASKYRVTHGAGVAIGLRAAGLLALRTGRFSRDEHMRVLTLLTLLGLPLSTRERPGSIIAAMRSDKKRRNGKVLFVLPRAIGDVEYGVPVREPLVRAALEQLMMPPGEREFH